jgi:Cytosine/uracil/thiamine/allantoin permeases
MPIRCRLSASTRAAGLLPAFWALQLYFVVHGTDSIRWLETFSAPIKIVMCLVLVWWAIDNAGGLGTMMHMPRSSSPAARRKGSSGTCSGHRCAMVGFWATLALNIPDFTRFARSQRDQLIGQTIGLPLPMGCSR